MDDQLPPPRLYKYRSLEGPSLEHFEGVVLKNQIWWASPLTFNDPFDCFPSVDVSGSSAERAKWLKLRVNRNYPDLSRQQRRLKMRELAPATKQLFGSTAANEGGADAWRDARRAMGVLSLTAKPTDMLMWGHYANSHQGACLEFDTSHPPFNLAHRICYDDERPIFRPLNADRSDLMERTLLRKAKVWEYEDECEFSVPEK